MHLREARPEDALEVAVLHVRSWQAAYRGLLPEDFLAGLDPQRRAVDYDFAAGGFPLTMVAEHETRIRGFATIGPCSDATNPGPGELYGLYVDPDSWRQGCGGLLISDARGRLAASGFTHGVLWVLAGNSRAEAFYEADGWTRDGGERVGDIGPGWRAASTADCEVPAIHEFRYRRTL